MLVVGLTGGIGAGKSTLAALLAERGAQIIDADQLGRDALKPGRPAWHSVVAQFGEEILAPHTMEIDRSRLASIVFTQKEKLAALNAIVHPVILKGIADHVESLRRTDEIVILDAALIVELGLDDALDVVVAVTTDDKRRSERLLRDRKMSEADIAGRIAAQGKAKEIEEKADIVVRNNGDIDDLTKEADRVWSELLQRRMS